MFGHNDDNQQQDQNQNTQSTAPANDQPAAGFPAFTPPAPAETPAQDTNTDNGTDGNMPLPGSSTSLPGSLTDQAPSADASAAPAPATTAPAAPEPDNGLTASPNDLLRIKQDALQQLSPLVDHLEQSPEERFRTIMMMIQATDDSSLIKEAYDIAQQITDEKVKAQALLDVVNEINYFSQQLNGQEQNQEQAA